MDLKTLVAALLPAESREHILGDLEERGYRSRDLVTAVPAAWWNHLQNAALFPAGVDVLIRAEAFREQFIQRSLVAYTFLGAFLGFVNGGLYREMSLRRMLAICFMSACSLLATRFALSRNFPMPGSRDAWIGAYRRQLVLELRNARGGFPHFAVYLAAVQAIQEIWPAWNTNDVPLRIAITMAGFGLCIALNHPRARRLRRELARLEITKRT